MRQQGLKEREMGRGREREVQKYNSGLSADQNQSLIRQEAWSLHSKLALVKYSLPGIWSGLVQWPEAIWRVCSFKNPKVPALFCLWELPERISCSSIMQWFKEVLQLQGKDFESDTGQTVHVGNQTKSSKEVYFQSVYQRSYFLFKAAIQESHPLRNLGSGVWQEQLVTARDSMQELNCRKERPRGWGALACCTGRKQKRILPGHHQRAKLISHGHRRKEKETSNKLKSQRVYFIKYQQISQIMGTSSVSRCRKDYSSQLYVTVKPPGRIKVAKQNTQSYTKINPLE